MHLETDVIKMLSRPIYSPDNTTKGLRRKWRNPLFFLNKWRRVWDLNPRGAQHAYTISSRAPSAARTTLRVEPDKQYNIKYPVHIRSQFYQLCPITSSYVQHIASHYQKSYTPVPNHMLTTSYCHVIFSAIHFANMR